jgi:hypothetical protein
METWNTVKTLKDIAAAYQNIYEKKEVDPSRDKDGDGDNDFADNMIARMVASGMSREEAIEKVKNKEYNKEEFELVDEATRMGKELGKEGETATRKELARRSNAYQRSGSVDKTIAAAERGAKSPYVKPVRGESDADRATRERKQSKTLSDLAASRRGSVRDKPRAGLRGYGADVTGSDRELQNSRRSAMAAGTLTPRERKMLNKEAYETYEFVASYLLENNFAESVEDANVIINNMSEGWFDQIIEGAAGDVADRAAKLARQKKGQTPERKKMYQDLASKAAERERGPYQGGDTRTGMTASDRERRRESGAYHDSVFGDGTRTYGKGGVTKNPRKLAQQIARGQHAEG